MAGKESTRESDLSSLDRYTGVKKNKWRNAILSLEARGTFLIRLQLLLSRLLSAMIHITSELPALEDTEPNGRNEVDPRIISNDESSMSESETEQAARELISGNTFVI